ncbi:FAD dependent oxidoreductase [Apiospora hydei]|uniref:FAD dependent oxidoreductase n=1 Tax=Apiospora hydei TaxID=1337664 RepID=A0ABR1UVD7_9PEZI
MVEKAVVVIGAGVSGLIAAKRLIAEGLNVRVFERADGPGGVWLYNADATAPFASPMYDPLETNFPRDLMELADHPWPKNAPLYPSHQQVLDYLRSYSEEVEVEYGTEVVGLVRRTRMWPHRWQLTIKKRGSKEETKLDFDHAVVCIGTFDKPFMPEYDGLAEWQEAYPDTNVVIVGTGPSGDDIANKLSRVAKAVWWSTRGSQDRVAKPRITPAGPIKKFHHKAGTIEFENGKRIAHIDKVIYCTGYHYSHEFIRRGGFRIDGLWKHMFWIEEPSLVFIGVPKEGPTFLISQAQAAYAARHVAGISHLPSKLKMTMNAADELVALVKANVNVEKMPHQLRGDRAKEYIEDLRRRCEEDAAKKRGQLSVDGNEPFEWTDRIDWIMTNRGRLRERYIAKCHFRRNYPTPESLGFKGVPKRK